MDLTPSLSTSPNNPRKRRYLKTDRQYLSENELADLLRSIKDPRDLAIFYIASRYGLRASEVGKLRFRELDMVAASLFIHRLKNGESGEHMVPAFGIKLLRAYLRVRGTSPGPLFLSRNGQPVSRQRLHDLMNLYASAAQLPEPLRHFHVLRHTAGTLALDHGDLTDVQGLLGHRDPRSTVVYAKIRNSRRRAFEERLPDNWVKRKR